MERNSELPEIGVIALRSFEEMGKKVDKALVDRFKKSNSDNVLMIPDSFLIKTNQVRFANGEGKVQIQSSVRGKDIFILCDVGNHSCTYQLHGYTNHMGPDEHFQDLKRTLSSIGGKARRTTVIMPLLYSSRQDKRRGRESLDCAMALQELENMGIENIMTFDVHNAAVQNAIPLTSFENLYATYNIAKNFLIDTKGKMDREKLVVISPDTGAMDRAIFYANLLDADVGLFYKRRDHRVIQKGNNPIAEHKYLGNSLEGHSVFIVDDIIGSGDSILDIVEQLRKEKVSKIYAASTFAWFTGGTKKFDEYYEKGLIERVYSTNLTYITDEIKNTPWFQEVEMSSFLAELIETLSHSRSLAPLLDASVYMKKLNKYK